MLRCGMLCYGMLCSAPPCFVPFGTDTSPLPPAHRLPERLPALPCLPPAQVGQLSIPTLPSNYRTSADQLSYVQMDFP